MLKVYHGFTIMATESQFFKCYRRKVYSLATIVIENTEKKCNQDVTVVFYGNKVI